MEPMKYLHNLTTLWPVAVLLLIGVVLVVIGVVRTLLQPLFLRGIWPVGIGVVLTVFSLFLLVGLNNTAFYPSTADLQSSLTIANACSSEFTLCTMAWVSLFIPFVLAYIFVAWRAIDKRRITKEEIAEDEAY